MERCSGSDDGPTRLGVNQKKKIGNLLFRKANMFNMYAYDYLIFCVKPNIVLKSTRN